MRKHLTYLLIIILPVTGCFKDEKPIDRKDRGSVVLSKAELGADYRNQIYFNLLSNNNLLTIDKFSWDIALSGNKDNPFIELNTSRASSASLTDKTQLIEIRDTIGFYQSRLFDYPCGYPDSLALSGILHNKKVYIIDLGYDESSMKVGHILLKANITNGKYYLEYSNINGSNYRMDSFSFDNSFNRILYNLKTGKTTMEPLTNSWDFLFTQYMHIYYNPFQTYSVTGCLINTHHLKASVYNGTKKFNELTINDTTSAFSNRRDIIGFDWKYYNLQRNQYYINDKKCYFIKHTLGKFYKLHFIDFYNQNGIKGTPVFEYQEL